MYFRPPPRITYAQRGSKKADFRASASFLINTQLPTRFQGAQAACLGPPLPQSLFLTLMSMLETSCVAMSLQPSCRAEAGISASPYQFRFTV